MPRSRWQALAAAARGVRTPAEERALAALAVVARKLREAHAEVARLGAAPLTTTAPDGVAAADSPEPVGWEDVEADLLD